MTNAVNVAALGSSGVSTGFKNRIINGDMRIDQRNAGASGTTINAFVTDRWLYAATQASKGTWQQNAGSVTPPTGFVNYLGFTSSSAYSVASGDVFAFTQKIEGYNIADLGWGTANAKAVTISFQVYSSLTGTFGGVLKNSASNRSYPFTYTVSVANTWTTISVTVAGDTSGTWLTTNGIGIGIYFSLGTGSTYSGTAGAWAGTDYWSATGATSVVGTNGATFYITGVQLEVGTTATNFDYRNVVTEFQLCQRYYQTGYFSMAGSSPGGASIGGWSPFKVTMRTSPTITYTDSLNANTNAGTSSSGVSATADGCNVETLPTVTSGWRFARSYTASGEL